jgi:hypothetical protein
MSVVSYILTWEIWLLLFDTMNLFHQIYLAVWVVIVAIAIVLMISKRSSIALFRRSYWRFLFIPWKVVTFFLAFLGITVMGPYTDDPTWDFVTAPMMSMLTFATAPWSVGTLYKAIKKDVGLAQSFVAAVLWMISASWSYDLYLLFRYGFYPPTWAANIVLSSILYCGAGLLWNLEWNKEKRTHFSFENNDWPVPPEIKSLHRIVWYVIAFILGAAAILLPFIIKH